MNIYVGNLPKTADEQTIRNLFAEHGEISEIKLIKDQFSGELRGFGFIEMPSKAQAQAAIQAINGMELDGRTLIVNEARPRREKTGGGHQRSGGSGGGGGFRGPRSRSW